MASSRPAVLVRLIAVLAYFAATAALPDVFPVGDGSRDFDFHIGTWKMHLKRLVRPLAELPDLGRDGWHNCRVTRLGWSRESRKLKASGPGGHFRGLSLRLYSPETRTWSLNFASYVGLNNASTTPSVG